MGVVVESAAKGLVALGRSELRKEDKRRAAEKAANAKKRKLDEIGREPAGPAMQQTNIVQAFTKQDNERVHSAVAQFFYANEIAFNVARSPYFKKIISAVNTAAGRYQPPCFNTLRGRLLEQEVERVQERLRPIVDSIEVTGSTLTSDGWSSAQNRPLLNFLLVTPKGNVFLKAEDTSGKAKTAAYIADTWLECMEEAGAERVQQVVSDSAANCKAAGAIIESRVPHVTWTPCTGHCLDLALEDIGDLDWAKDVVRQGKEVVHFITNHHKSQHIYRVHAVAAVGSPGLQLLKPGETRFGTNFIMLERMLKVRDALEEVVVDRDWKAWMDGGSAALRNAGAEIQSTVVSTSFWRKVQELVDICWRIVALMKQVDAGTPMVGKVYWRMHEILLKLDDIDAPASHCNRAKHIVRERWDMLHLRMHAAGFVLDPEF
ncbi:hypothetical protein KFL_000560400 [Klebsormidium nitens]|uniref:DUF659 domain-containing protein n=1 Tax=Klebsormidium nitens TaxID=105231 RepID=A0A1Y1HU79_KLENI|nr:hypothetical protein KFL_000560400 [Klebsormidium nitens]|eukprot:GAQ80551.1 hypothetical protein KFL_000560400 [Klebsormidium nitens]